MDTRAFYKGSGVCHCEPGNLPSGITGMSPVLWGLSPQASTEVVMAHSKSVSLPLSLSDRFVAGILALMLGSFLVYGAGFASADVLHDTAHDTRHANVFPCH